MNGIRLFFMVFACGFIAFYGIVLSYIGFRAMGAPLWLRAVPGVAGICIAICGVLAAFNFFGLRQ
jgi:hypothetical protein